MFYTYKYMYIQIHVRSMLLWLFDIDKTIIYFLVDIFFKSIQNILVFFTIYTCNYFNPSLCIIELITMYVMCISKEL